VNHLYQLREQDFKRLPSGSVRIDGPWDTYGVLIKLQSDGTWLIRGTGHKRIT
jgi:hypothetical protein